MNGERERVPAVIRCRAAGGLLSALWSMTFTKRSLKPPRNAATTNVANSLVRLATWSRLLCSRKYSARPKIAPTSGRYAPR